MAVAQGGVKYLSNAIVANTTRLGLYCDSTTVTVDLLHKLHAIRAVAAVTGNSFVRQFIMPPSP